MQPNPNSPFNESQPGHGVCVADGWGIRIYVARGHLIVDDGIGRVRRERRFHKATSGLERLLIIGRSGFQTFEAARWLADAQINVIHLDSDGRVLSVSGSGPDKPSLRRAQASASTNHTGIEVMQHLLELKITGQAEIAQYIGGQSEEINDRLAQIREAADLDSLRHTEAQAAITYWQAWDNVTIRFARSDQNRIPEHWSSFGHRRSLKSPSGRRSVNPINAILNYLYALLEGEARIASIAVGLDPGLGILHLDKRARDSFALDLMEAARPAVDRYVIDLLEGHVFRAVDFTETRQGGCRIGRTLAHRLGETTGAWRESLAKPAEDVATLLVRSSIRGSGDRSTPLTQSNRRRAHGSDWVGPAKPQVTSAKHCRECGETNLGAGRLCTECRRQFEESGAWLEMGRGQIAYMRARGEDPAHGGEAAEMRAQTVSRQNLASRAWSRENPERPSDEVFVEQILTGLQSVRLREMVRVTGLSLDYCSKIRRGQKVPHPRHWSALAELASE